MNGPKERVLIAHDGADLWLDGFRAKFPDLPLRVAGNAGELADALESFGPTVCYSCTTDGFPRHLHTPLIHCPSLRWLHVGGSGFEHFAGRDPKRLVLTNGVGVLAGFLADTAIGALIALNNGLLGYARAQAEKIWRQRPFPPLQGQRLLVLGPGAIGKAVAARARALGMVTVAIGRRPGPIEPFDEVHPMSALVAEARRADVVSLHLRLTDETRHIVDSALLGELKPSCILVNTGRGGLVDQPALEAALGEGRIAGAYLDVFEDEPLPPSSPLWSMPNVLITPHAADQVSDWQERHAALFMDNLERWLDGRPLLNRQD